MSIAWSALKAGAGVHVDAVVQGPEHGDHVRPRDLDREVAADDGHAPVELRVARVLPLRHEGVRPPPAQGQPAGRGQPLDVGFPLPRLRGPGRGHAPRLGGFRPARDAEDGEDEKQ